MVLKYTFKNISSKWESGIHNIDIGSSVSAKRLLKISKCIVDNMTAYSTKQTIFIWRKSTGERCYIFSKCIKQTCRNFYFKNREAFSHKDTYVQYSIFQLQKKQWNFTWWEVTKYGKAECQPPCMVNRNVHVWYHFLIPR